MLRCQISTNCSLKYKIPKSDDVKAYHLSVLRLSITLFRGTLKHPIKLQEELVKLGESLTSHEYTILYT
jgi:hypothetical protein